MWVQLPPDPPMPRQYLEVIEGEDYYYDESGEMVFTEKYLTKRGRCCQSGCKHCPYGYKKDSDS